MKVLGGMGQMNDLSQSVPVLARYLAMVIANRTTN